MVTVDHGEVVGFVVSRFGVVVGESDVEIDVVDKFGVEIDVVDKSDVEIDVVEVSDVEIVVGLMLPHFL